MCGESLQKAESGPTSGSGSSGSGEFQSRKSRVRQKTMSVEPERLMAAKEEAIAAFGSANKETPAEELPFAHEDLFAEEMPAENFEEPEDFEDPVVVPQKHSEPEVSSSPFRLGGRSSNERNSAEPVFAKPQQESAVFESSAVENPAAESPAENLVDELLSEEAEHVQSEEDSWDDHDSEDGNLDGDDSAEDGADDFRDFAPNANQAPKKRRRRRRKRGGARQEMEHGQSQAHSSDHGHHHGHNQQASHSHSNAQHGSNERSSHGHSHGNAHSQGHNSQPRVSTPPPARQQQSHVEQPHAEQRRWNESKVSEREAPAREEQRMESRTRETESRAESHSPSHSAPVHTNQNQRQNANRVHHAKPEASLGDGQLVGWLVNFRDNPKGEAVEIRAGRFFVSGQRLRGSDLVLPHDSVSTPHCLVKVSDSGTIQLQDMMSENGTYRRSQDGSEEQIDSTVVRNGDTLRFGDYEVLVCLIPRG